MVLKSFDQGSALFILVEAPPFDLLEIKILFKNNHLPKIGAVPSSLSLFWLATPNQTPRFWWSYSKLHLPGGDFYAVPGPVQQAAV